MMHCQYLRDLVFLCLSLVLIATGYYVVLDMYYVPLCTNAANMQIEKASIRRRSI